MSTTEKNTKPLPQEKKEERTIGEEDNNITKIYIK